MRAQVRLMGLFPHRLRAKLCLHIRLRARPSMDHPLVHPFRSGTRWLLPGSILISPYHQANRPCTVTLSHEPGSRLLCPLVVLLYIQLLMLYLLAVALVVTLYY